jgi:hypothetical protein
VGDRSFFAALIFLLSLLLVSGCSDSQPQMGTATLARPTPAQTGSSTLAPVTSPVPSIQPTLAPPKPTEAAQARAIPTLDCVDSLGFVADLTVPDGTQIARGVDVDKRWQVKNTGTCNWDSNYRLILVAGPELGLPQEQALIPARAGAEAVLRLLLTSPVVPGLYTSAWQARNPVGELFGDVIYIEIQVN